MAIVLGSEPVGGGLSHEGRLRDRYAKMRRESSHPAFVTPKYTFRGRSRATRTCRPLHPDSGSPPV